MSLAAESPSPSPSSSSGSDDFAALLDAELDLASAVDSASVGDPSTSPTSSDDEEDDDEDVVADVETVEQSRQIQLDYSVPYSSHGKWEVTLFCCAAELLKLRIDRSVTGTPFACWGAEASAKRRKVKVQYQDRETAIRPDEDSIGSSEDAQIKICPPHPGYFGGLCFRCGKRQDEEDVPGVAFGYVHKGLRLGTTEIDRLRGSDLKNLLRERKLILILDLDHTLINSTKLHDISAAENNLGIQTAASKDDPNGSLFTLEGMQMLTKLRPFVRKFLKEASNMFEMYIYTMGDKAYAIEIAKLLDPRNVYFNSKVISNSDCTQRHQKGLDMVLGAESVAVILDDTEYVWQKHKENLILMERYHYFASSCRQFGFSVKSLSEFMQDERGSDGALATILDVLKRIHTIFFDSAVETALSSRDVRQVIKRVRQEVLQGCKLVFSRVFPSSSRPQDQFIWKMAEQLGAICSADVDSTITHVVAVDVGTDKARWAVNNNKILVHPRWIEASNFRWHRQQEEDFPVKVKKNEKDKENDVAAATDAANGKVNDVVAAATDPANEKDKEDDVAPAATDPANEKDKEIDVAAAVTDSTNS
ncbi:RNA polymerase II C-terminal domain phosphatase-like 4 [Triticum urartu]|uniref:RNA polymerase II C-terminal domain phosphatase-like n=1 Tax=Triticum urartu TaxID=4572 RepID=M7ZE65_TRIUA|nr:RNA polymerase II C-terminal domain phosphatase-like 4 [Triticum urartu]